ncbi:phage tail protein [Paracraurococcus lichenis]|uniref:Phage tail protein n=1 Tax=Paracraurococcus lichenis TaxID=3064888 RepID=A0ABT9E9S6_9PROT|nr:phage tail protein [Paracraurococcus sp. LOR1-02]MDO9712906.1 phage tail protein [Paracraurococcus sp. LOR1-02]
MPVTGERNDPYRSFNFEVEIDNLPIGAFSEVTGLSSDGDSVDYREGNYPDNIVRKLVGLRKVGPITLKRGYVRNDLLWQWYANIARGVPDRRNGAVVLKNEAHNDVLRWNFVAAWPNKIEGPSLKASGNEVAIESIELMHEGIVLELA